MVALKNWPKGYLVPEPTKEFTVVKTEYTLRFLERVPVLIDLSMYRGIVIRAPAAYAQKMDDVLGVSEQWASKVPCNKTIVSQYDSTPLGPERTSQHSSAIGAGMYMSNDRLDIAYTARMLSTWPSKRRSMRGTVLRNWPCTRTTPAVV